MKLPEISKSFLGAVIAVLITTVGIQHYMIKRYDELNTKLTQALDNLMAVCTNSKDNL